MTGAGVVGAAVGGSEGKSVGANVGGPVGRRVGFEVGLAVVVGASEGLSDGSGVLGAELGGAGVGLIVKKNGSSSYKSSSIAPLSTGERVCHGSITVHERANAQRGNR